MTVTLQKFIPSAGFALAILLLSCGDSLAHCGGKHTGDHPHCQGGGDPGGDPAGEQPLNATFRCPEVGVDRNCSPTGSVDLVQGDGNGVWEEGVDDANVIINSNGTLIFGTGGNKKHGSIRNVYTDFTQGPGGAVPVSSGAVTTTDALAFPYRTKFQINRRNDIEDLRDITVGQTMWLDMWLDVTISDGGPGSIIWVRFDSMDDNSECQSAGSEDVPVHRETETRWIVDVPAGTVGCVYVLDRDQSNSGNKGDWVLGPFKIEFNAM